MTIHASDPKVARPLDEDDARAAMRLLRTRMGWGRIMRMAEDLWKEENASEGLPEEAHDRVVPYDAADVPSSTSAPAASTLDVGRDARDPKRSPAHRPKRNLAKMRRARERRRGRHAAAPA